MEGSKLDRLTHTGFLSFEIPAQIWKTYASVLHSTVLSFWSFRSNFGTFMEFLPNFQFFRQMSAYPYLAWNFWFGPNRQSWHAGLPVFKHMIRAGFDANNAVCACRSKNEFWSLLSQSVRSHSRCSIRDGKSANVYAIIF